MRALHRWDDALDLREALESIECLLVRDRDVLDNPFIFIIGMLWSDARVVEASRDGVRLDDLAVRVLKQVAEGAVQDARLTSTGERLGVVRRRLATAARLDTELLDGRIVAEIVERADGVAAAADAG